MAHIGKSTKSNFQIVFSSIPGTTVSEDNSLKLNIFDTVLPGINLQDTELHHNGARIYDAMDIEYDEWNVNFHIDENFDNYFIIFDWIMYIYDGNSRFAREMDDYQINADLLILDNYDNVKHTLTLVNMWPRALSDVTMSYQEASEYNIATATFRYDFIKKNT